MSNECETPTKGVKAYFQTISLGLKVYYSRKEALSVILEDVREYPCLIVSPLNTGTTDTFGRPIQGYEVGVLDICEQDFDETNEEKKMNVCINLLRKIIKSTYYAEQKDFIFERADMNFTTFYDKFDANTLGAFTNIYLKKNIDICD